jgi:hypothetical protein
MVISFRASQRLLAGDHFLSIVRLVPYHFHSYSRCKLRRKYWVAE